MNQVVPQGIPKLCFSNMPVYKDTASISDCISSSELESVSSECTTDFELAYDENSNMDHALVEIESSSVSTIASDISSPSAISSVSIADSEPKSINMQHCYLGTFTAHCMEANSSGEELSRIIYLNQFVNAQDHEYVQAKSNLNKEESFTKECSDDTCETILPVASLIRLPRTQIREPWTNAPLQSKIHLVHQAASFYTSTQDEWYLPYVDIQAIVETYIRRNYAVVDLGAGRSALAKNMVLRGYNNVTRIDINRLFLDNQEGIELAEFLHYEHMDATKLTFSKKSIDAVIAKAFFEFHQVETQLQIIYEIIDCLRPGGIFIVISLADRPWWTEHNIDQALNASMKLIKSVPVGPLVGTHQDHHHICQALVWQTHESSAEERYRRMQEDAEDFAASLEWRLWSYRIALAKEVEASYDTQCREIHSMRIEDWISLHRRQNEQYEANVKALDSSVDDDIHAQDNMPPNTTDNTHTNTAESKQEHSHSDKHSLLSNASLPSSQENRSQVMSLPDNYSTKMAQSGSNISKESTSVNNILPMAHKLAEATVKQVISQALLHSPSPLSDQETLETQ